MDVFICTSMYDEINRQVRKLPPEGMRRYPHSSTVTEDEIYYFPKLINPPKVGIHIISFILQISVKIANLLEQAQEQNKMPIHECQFLVSTFEDNMKIIFFIRVVSISGNHVESDLF